MVSAETVETHVSSVLRKLQLSSRHELTRWATDRKLLWPAVVPQAGAGAAVTADHSDHGMFQSPKPLEGWICTGVPLISTTSPRRE